jgi:hypothetical protein
VRDGLTPKPQLATKIRTTIQQRICRTPFEDIVSLNMFAPNISSSEQQGLNRQFPDIFQALTDHTKIAPSVEIFRPLAFGAIAIRLTAAIMI